jgi:hypothetical protein
MISQVLVHFPPRRVHVCENGNLDCKGNPLGLLLNNTGVNLTHEIADKLQSMYRGVCRADTGDHIDLDAQHPQVYLVHMCSRA